MSLVSTVPVRHVPVGGVGEEKFSFCRHGHLDVLPTVNVLLGPVHNSHVATPDKSLKYISPCCGVGADLFG